jgi:hypothetical protein
MSSAMQLVGHFLSPSKSRTKREQVFQRRHDDTARDLVETDVYFKGSDMLGDGNQS